MPKRPNKYPASHTMRKREIQLIHIAKQQLGMDDETYRAMLWTVATVKSSSELDWQGRKKVLDHLKACGFKVTASKTKPSRKLADDPESRKVRALWIMLHELGAVRNPAESALAVYVKRLTKVDDLHWINGEQAEVVIESLKKWAMRFLPARVEAMAAQVSDAVRSSSLHMPSADVEGLSYLVGIAQTRRTFDPMQHAYQELKKWLAR